MKSAEIISREIRDRWYGVTINYYCEEEFLSQIATAITAERERRINWPSEDQTKNEVYAWWDADKELRDPSSFMSGVRWLKSRLLDGGGP